ncbi:ribosome maturation factor RimM [Sodaliphilus sp.]|uniref:ribosome maturation factor RimM n=1 Tax=Sodaliphilus sp. TaxID=2815818 RepID=UPI00388FC659
MILRDDILCIGRYNKPHGVNGEISASLDVDFEFLRNFSCLISEIDGIYVPFFVEYSRAKSAVSALITIDGITNEREATLLVNKDIYVRKDEYESISSDEDCDEMPIDYFIGFTLYSQEGARVGEIIDVDDATENVLFIVETPEGDEVDIPAADELVTDIDMDGESITMSLPEGLLDI